MAELRGHFDLDPALIYLNSGSHSIAPREVIQAMHRYQLEYESNPTLGLFGAWERMWKTQKEVAAWFHAAPDEIFFRSNVTAALNAFILGIPLQRDGEILVGDLEYGAIVNLCRMRAERSGLALRVFHLPSTPDELAGLTPARLAELVIAQLRPGTRLLLLSHVMTATGLALPLAEIARETRRRGVLLVVDGAHGPGAMDVDFRGLQDVDFYGGNFHKWMMGPKGTSFGWVPRRLHESLEPTQGGWTTFETPKPFARFGEGSRFAARMLMSACHDFAPFFALHETLGFWDTVGAARIRARLRELQVHAIGEFRRVLGWTLLSPEDPALRGPLLAFELPARLQPLGYDLMFQLLRDHGLMISTAPLNGGFCLRVSPHIHNTEEEITRAAGILARL